MGYMCHFQFWFPQGICLGVGLLGHNLAATAKLLQSCPTLCDPIDDSPPGSPVPGILQARTLEWIAISFSNAWKWKVKSESEVAQSCPTPSSPMDCSLPGSSVHGIFQARVLEWGAIAFSIFHRGCINLHSHQQWKSVPSSPAFIVCRLFGDGHSDWCEVIAHCSFDLHFSNNVWCWASFHVLVISCEVFRWH